MTCKLGPDLRDEDDCAAAAERDDWINADARGPEVLCDIKLVMEDTEGTLLFRLGESPDAVGFLGGIVGGRATMVGTDTCRCRNGLLVECVRSSILGGTLVSSESDSELESDASNATDLDRGFFSGLARRKSP
jgi:hypothetical protein